MAMQYLFTGSYAETQEEGIQMHSFDSESGKCVKVAGFTGFKNPSYLRVDAARGILYTVSEAGRGAVAALKLEQAGGGWQAAKLNEQSTGGGGACHLSVLDGTLAAANYGGGSVAAYPVEADGRIGSMAFSDQHEGKGPRADRQEGPHPHSAFFTPDGKYVLVPDLGIDKVFVYRVEGAGRLTPVRTVAVQAGAGPRHVAFHPNQPFVYVVNELDSTVNAYRYAAGTGDLQEVQSVSMLPQGFAGVNIAADIHLTPDGRYLYASNRGHDSIAAFAVDGANGTLRAIGHTPVQGSWPRNFAVSPDGRFLVVANQNTDNAAVFAIDRDSGALRDTGNRLSVGKPTCLQFATL